MTTATVNSTATDLETAFDYGARIEELGRFVDEEMKPACDRLEAAGYPGSLLAGVLDHNPRGDPEFDLILDQLDMVRAANGQPGVADWLFYRVSTWSSLDDMRAELERGDDTSAADAAVAFDREFAAAHPELERLVSVTVRAKEGASNALRRMRPDAIINGEWSDVKDVDGHSLYDIEAEVREAVAKMTGAAKEA